MLFPVSYIETDRFYGFVLRLWHLLIYFFIWHSEVLALNKYTLASEQQSTWELLFCPFTLTEITIPTWTVALMLAAMAVLVI